STIIVIFIFTVFLPHRHLHSFPTRRSSDLALQMVPGLEVVRIDENKWAIGSRGFNGRFDNKLLVLIDGRSVYTPLFSGVYWNVRSEEHTSELQSPYDLVCRLLLEKKKKKKD